jgi:hypothetical protein
LVTFFCVKTKESNKQRREKQLRLYKIRINFYKMINPKQKAEELYLTTEKSQKEIAQQLGIDPKTLYRWIRQGQWRELKSTTRRMPSVLVENIYSQLDDINYSISQRERGSRHPGKDESLTINRLINCIEKVKKQTSQGQNIEFMMNFIDWVLPQNKDLADLLTNYGSAFLKGTQIHGFHPYDIEYPNPEVDEEDDHDEELKGRHPELVSGPHANTDILAQETSPLERGQGCVLPGSEPWPTDPNSPSKSTERHPELVSGPHANTDILAQEISPLERGQGCVSPGTALWPTDPNSPSQSKDRHPELVSGPHDNTNNAQSWPTDPNNRAQTGHDSGSPIQLEINFQLTENQSKITETLNNPMPQMPENNSPEDRAPEIPLLRGDVPQTTDVVSEQGCVQPGSEPQPDGPFPPASEIDFSNPNILYELAMKQKKESEDEYQFYSIGEAVYRMKIDKTKKKRR